MYMIKPDSLGTGGGETNLRRPTPALMLVLILVGVAWLVSPASAGAATPLSLTPSPFVFHGASGSKVGETSKPHEFTIRNVELAEATVEKVEIVDREPGKPSFERESFQISSNPCEGKKLLKAETCVVKVTFNSPTYEIVAANLLVEASGHKVEALLNGSAEGVELSLAPDTWSFGTIGLGAKSAVKRFRVKREGNIPLTGIEPAELVGSQKGQFEIVTGGEEECGTELGGELDARNKCYVEVAFAPTVIGLATAQLRVNSAAGAKVAELTGTGEAARADLTPPTFDFGPIGVDEESEAEDFKLKNESAVAALTMEAPELDGAQNGEFKLVASSSPCPVKPATLAPQAECEIAVVFAPQNPDPAMAFLVVKSDAVGSPFRREVSGSGTGAKLGAIPSSHPFGSQAVGTSSKAVPYVIEDTGTSALLIEEVELGGADPTEFTLNRNGCEGPGALLQVGGQCTISVGFAPIATPGSKTATLEIKTNGGDETSELTGTATQTEGILTPVSHPFGSIEVGDASAAFMFEVENPGPGTLTIEAIARAGAQAGEFVLEGGTCGAAPKTLAATTSCTIGVRFEPNSTGAKEAKLKVFAGGGEPLEATLEGTGT